jgi:hypothetical protein
MEKHEVVMVGGQVLLEFIIRGIKELAFKSAKDLGRLISVISLDTLPVRT